MTNKYALITGASGEIGSATALAFANSGINLILHYNENVKAIELVKKNCLNVGVEVHLIQADLSKIEEINLMFSHIKMLNIKPEILVNTVGITHYGLIQDVDYSDFEKIMNINFMATFYCSQKVIPDMIRLGFGRIINISSVWGNIGAANEVLYSSSKGAINTFTKALAKELGPSGVTVNAIAPGIVLSKMMSNFNESELEELKVEIPVNRFAKASEIAYTILHLAHEDSSYITGQIITIDGGWT